MKGESGAGDSLASCAGHVQEVWSHFRMAFLSPAQGLRFIQRLSPGAGRKTLGQADTHIKGK